MEWVIASPSMEEIFVRSETQFCRAETWLTHWIWNSGENAHKLAYEIREFNCQIEPNDGKNWYLGRHIELHVINVLIKPLRSFCSAIQMYGEVF